MIRSRYSQFVSAKAVCGNDAVESFGRNHHIFLCGTISPFASYKFCNVYWENLESVPMRVGRILFYNGFSKVVEIQIAISRCAIDQFMRLARCFERGK